MEVNIFEATDTQIKELNPSLAFYLAPNEKGLRLKFYRKNLAFKFIKKYPEIHYLKKEKAYFFPTHEITNLIKSLKGKKTTFAVHEAAGRRLSISAETRRKIFNDEILPSNEDLEFSLLYPCAVSYQANQINLLGKNEFQKNIDKNQLCSLIYKSYFDQSKIWVSKEVIANLKESIEFDQDFDEQKLAISFPQLCFCTDSEHKPYLIIDSRLEYKFENFRIIQNPISRQKAKLVELSYNDIDNLFNLLSLNHRVIYSSRFKIALESLSETKNKLEKSRRYNSLKDAEIESVIANKLFPHQRVAVSWIKENDYGLLGDDMGLGKTLSVLASYDILRKEQKVDFILVICPNSLVKNWQRESKLWFSDMKLIDLPKSKVNREDLFKKLKFAAKDWISGLIVNFESCRSEEVLNNIIEIIRNRTTLLIIDEAQRAKNPKSKTFNALKKISEISKKRFLLSGTPTPKDFSDIWTQVYLADRGERFGKSFYAWLENIAVLGNKWSPFAVKKFKKKEVEDAALRVQEILLRRRKEEVVSLPEKLFSVRDVELSGEQKRRFDLVCKELVVKITKLNGAQYFKQIDSVLEQMLRAVQIASNPRLVDSNWKEQPAKFIELDLLVNEIVEENQKKLVIWTNYLENVKDLLERYSSYHPLAYSGEVSEKDRDLNIQKFQTDDKYKILIAIPAAGGVGITLTAAQTAIYLEKTWNAEHWMQSIDRIHRIGQTGTVNIISLHACFLDEVIYKNLQKKQRQQSSLMGDLQTEFISKEELLEALKP